MAWRDAVREAAGLPPSGEGDERRVAPMGLTPQQQLAHAAELMRKALGRTAPREEPTAILTGGQPGSGKSYITRSVGVRFDGVGGIVVIDPDEIRPTLPYMKERIAAGDLDVPDVANVDAGTIAYQMVQIAKRERRNVLVDGTLQNTMRAVGLADEMRTARYGVEFHGMAVYPDLSHARTYTRREEQIEASPTGFGRGVSDAFHDQAVKGYARTVDVLQAKASVDTMTFYGGDGGTLVETRFRNGQWTPAVSMRDELEREHTRPAPATLEDAAQTWRTAVDRMQARGASFAETAKVMGFRDAAVIRSVRAQIVHATEVEPRRDQGSRIEDIATIVHAGVAAAGRDADRAIMTVAWTPEEAILEITAPSARGHSRVTLPGHAEVEHAIHAGGPLETIRLDFADAPAGTYAADETEIARAAANVGVAAEAVRATQASTTQEKAPADHARAAASRGGMEK